ncbi:MULTISPECIES: helix-turn-helix domain-containing protein [Pseudomonas]|uniref:helix-turn-helix domain-containing protein n=1 Tax=Pseudomonas TaxID=286 RepID=UPI0030019E41
MSISYKVRSAALTGLIEESGEKLPELLSQSTITLEQLLDSDCLIDIEALQALMARASQVLGRSDLGLRLSTYQGLESFGLLGVMISRGHQLREAVLAAQNSITLHNLAESWTLIEYGERALIQRIEHVFFEQPAQQYREMCIANCFRLLRILGGNDIKPSRIEFAHSAISPLKTYNRFFGCEVLFEQELDGLVFSTEVLTRNVRPPAPETQRYLDSLLADLRKSSSENLELEVRNLLSQTLTLQQPTLESIAALLGIHPRTLQRRLEAEHLKFQTLLHDIKMKTACWHLQSSTTGITQLAFMLGYSDLSAFSRAFRRHTDSSPAQWRRSMQQPCCDVAQIFQHGYK